MAQLKPRPMTVEAFLAWERRQELRYEFDGIAPVAMAGGKVAHSKIATNLVEALRRRLRGGRCQAFRGDLKIMTQAGSKIRYPDAIVTCSPVDDADDIVPHPVVVFEVLSEATAGTDRVAKNDEYAGVPSIARYVMLEQDRAAATVFAREAGGWTGRLVTGMGAVLDLPEIGAELPLAELYDGVSLPGEAADD